MGNRGENDNPYVVQGAGSFDAFYRREYRSVLGLSLVLHGNWSGAEEITAEAFLAALRVWERIGSLDNPGAWVRRVVANQAVSAFRRKTSEAKALLLMGSDRTGTAWSIDAVDVWSEVRRLPRRQAQVIALTYFDDLPRREVAEILGCSQETVKTHLERGRRRLAERLEDSRSEPDGT